VERYSLEGERIPFESLELWRERYALMGREEKSRDDRSRPPEISQGIEPPQTAFGFFRWGAGFGTTLFFSEQKSGTKTRFLRS
jgi:hypothetical protein